MSWGSAPASVLGCLLRVRVLPFAFLASLPVKGPDQKINHYAWHLRGRSLARQNGEIEKPTA